MTIYLDGDDIETWHVPCEALREFENMTHKEVQAARAAWQAQFLLEFPTHKEDK